MDNKYTIIRTINQYKEYCTDLEKILSKETVVLDDMDNIELLTLLIEKWEKDNSSTVDISLDNIRLD